VSERADSQLHISTIRLYSAIHVNWFTRENTGQKTNTIRYDTIEEFNVDSKAEYKLKIQMIHKQCKNTAEQNYSGSVAFYDTRPRNEVGLFYNAPSPHGANRVDNVCAYTLHLQQAPRLLTINYSVSL